MRPSPQGFVTLLVEMTLMELRSRRLCRSLLLLAACSVISLICAAQASSAGSRPPSPSRVDLFGEYTYFHPVNSDMFNQQFPPITGGVAGGITGYFSRSFGIQGEYRSEERRVGKECRSRRSP